MTDEYIWSIKRITKSVILPTDQSMDRSVFIEVEPSSVERNSKNYVRFWYWAKKKKNSSSSVDAPGRQRLANFDCLYTGVAA